MPDAFVFRVSAPVILSPLTAHPGERLVVTVARPVSLVSVVTVTGELARATIELDADFVQGAIRALVLSGALYPVADAPRLRRYA